MNSELVEQLTNRAKLATETAEAIRALEEADPHKAGMRLSFHDFRNLNEQLPEGLLVKVVATGRLAVLAELEAKLRTLLGEETAKPAV